ncbi:LysE family translocator [Amylibacter sp.]|nr:LysE family translocator [Amylibacter sp.]MDB4095687.1 LysE family translocator [Amylibacter sp.]MDC0565159.1 LysE family translocator [Amylibacter sp.]
MITITFTQIALYSSALMILWLTPGPVWVAVLARSVSGGFKSSVPLVFGVAVGDLLWPLVALLGVSFLVSIYADILIVFRYIASIILIIMGIVLILKSDNFFKEESNLTKPGIWAGFSAVLANPKASLFYMTLLPNFFNFDKLNSVDIVTICCLSAIVPMLGNLILAIAVDKMRNFLSSPLAIKKTNIFSGIALILVGLIISF